MLNWVGPLLLCRDEIARVPRAVGGIYLLHGFAADRGGYPAFYAGQSRDLRRRLFEHLGDATAKPSVAGARRLTRSYFSAARVENPMLRAACESGLIQGLEPVCNDQCPGVAPVFPNLPPMFFFTPARSQ